MTNSFVGKGALVVAVALCSGCATLTSGTTQSVYVDTGNVAGADCTGTDKKGHKFHWLNTPSSTVVQKGDGPMIIECEKEGYEKATVTTDETLVGATFGNIIAGGGIGFLVDAASGAAQEYPDQIKIPMKPVGAAAEVAVSEEKPKEQKLAGLEETEKTN